jgi:serine/threonine protein kinase/Flp pilus assembly protein TadD
VTIAARRPGVLERPGQRFPMFFRDTPLESPSRVAPPHGHPCPIEEELSLPLSTCSNCGHALDVGARFCPACGTKVLAGVAAQGMIGRTLSDKYRVLEELGSGSMGTVYLAEHIGLKKKVALKILHDDLLVSEDTLQRFQREGIAAGKFTHPNAIQIFDFDRFGDLYYLAMEYVEGDNLAVFLRENGPMSPRTAVRFVSSVLGALAEAHGHGIVHRDLKPENIMVLRGATGDMTIKVLDFGLSKLVDRPVGASIVTQVGRIMGTPLYMAPEQAGGAEVDHRSDLYSVGLMLYECLTGKQPFQGNTITELLIKQATEPPPSIFETYPDLGVPHGLELVIRKALEKLRENRYASAMEMLADLNSVDLDGPARALAPSSLALAPRSPDAVARPVPSRAGSRSKPIVAIALGAIVIMVAWRVLAGSESAPAFARVSQKAPEARTQIESSYLSLIDSVRGGLAGGDPRLALAMVSQAHGMACVDAEAFLLRGRIHAAGGDVDAARLDIAEALARDPNYAEAAAALGWLHLDQGALEEAERAFTRAEEIDAYSSDALAGRGALAYLGDDRDAARALFLNATELDPSNGRAWSWLGRTLLDAGDVAGAQDALVKAKRNDGSWQTFAALGEVYLALDRVEDAERELKRALELDPGLAAAPRSVVAALATVYLDSNRFDDAIAFLAPRVRPPGRSDSDGPLHLLYGTALYRAGRTQDAIAALEAGLACGPDAEASLLLGILYRDAGRDAAAETALRAAIAANDGLAIAHLDLGLLLFARERFGDARDSVERALELDADLAYAHYALGLLYMDYLGEAGRAADHLERYQELGGIDKRVSTWLERLGRRQ